MEYEVSYKATKKDVFEMIELDNNNYSYLDAGDYNICLKWLKKCPEMYTLIKYDKRVVGYINLLSITERCYNQILLGNKKDYEIKLEEVENYKIGKNYCLFMSIVIDKNHSFSRALLLLIQGLKNKIKNLKRKGIIIDRVVADCVSVDGEKLANHLGGKYICASKTGSKIFEFFI